MKQERLALIALGVILVGLPLAFFGYQRFARPTREGHRVIDIQASLCRN